MDIARFEPGWLLPYALKTNTALSACASLIIFLYDTKIMDNTGTFFTHMQVFVNPVVVITLPAIGGIIGTIGLTHLTRSRLPILLGFIYATCLTLICARDFMENDPMEIEVRKAGEVKEKTAAGLLLLGSLVNILANGIFFYKDPSTPRAFQLGANLPLLAQSMQAIRSSWNE